MTQPEDVLGRMVETTRLEILICDQCLLGASVLDFFAAIHDHIEHTPELKRLRDELNES